MLVRGHVPNDPIHQLTADRHVPFAVSFCLILVKQIFIIVALRLGTGVKTLLAPQYQST
jgi:hypothetical protein